MEKRALIRNDMQISVACSSLTTGSSASASNGVMLNCSRGGTCIELNQRLYCGSILMIKATGRIAKENAPVAPEGFRTLSLAEVKWIKPQDGQGACHYIIGLKYLPTR
jgi:hypothetical protein